MNLSEDQYHRVHELEMMYRHERKTNRILLSIIVIEAIVLAIIFAKL